LQCFATTDPRNHPEIFACGDAARVIGGQGRWPTMVRAIEAFWQAKTVAANIAALAKEPAHYNRGVPPLRPHKLRASFFYGVSVGRRSLIVRGPVILDVPWINHWFRRWLMGRYFARYRSMLLESKQETGTVPSLRREP
jgi:NADH dehydrogenase FAD-containing subunit